MKRNATEEILTSLVDRDDHVRFAALPVKGVTWRINHRIQKTLGEIETMHQVRSFLHVSGNERQSFLRLGIPLPRRSNCVLKEFVAWLAHIPVEDDRPQRITRTLSNIEAQPVLGFDRVVHIDVCIAMLAVEDFEKKREIVAARRA